MNCPTCGHVNPPEAKFCQNCGTDLRFACPNCGEANSRAARFCQNCGHRLAEPAADPHPAAAPEPVRPADPPASEGERRVVTILFADVKGSTALAERLDPEEWTEIIDGAFRRLIPAVTRYEGTVARLMGDGLLALFGAPIAHEDDALRAVLAGLDMLADFTPYREDVLTRLRSHGVYPETDDFRIRVGISTGLVVVGIVGSEEKREYTAMGDAINLAARMEQTAAPGTIQITHDTYRLIETRVEADVLGDLAIKGKRRPVRVYRVTGLQAQTQRARGISSLSSPLIGRGREKQVLLAVLDRLNQGHGQILSLIGEAGLGKSRLLTEVRTAAEEREISWIEAASLSYEGDHPYGLIRHLLRSFCGCSPDDPTGIAREKISKALDDLPTEMRAQVERAFDLLFAIRDKPSGENPSREDMQDLIYNGVETVWRYRAAGQPLVIALEDLHWSDPASVDLVRHLFTLVNRGPVLFLCVFRPSRRSEAWGLKQAGEQDYPHRYTEILLSPLSTDDTNTLVENLLKATDLPKRVVDLILDKAEGNPFFVEELVGELVEREVVVPVENGEAGWKLAVSIEDIELPESLEALLVARMDRLEERPRQTLQMAAVIGRNFYFRVLKLISDGLANIEDHLAGLERSGMILEARRIPEREYMFRHVLTQEAAYNTMLLRRRRIFHQRTGEVMESLFGDHLEEQAALLAHHFMRAGNAERALRYATLAAEHAARLHANMEAIVHYGKALEIAGATEPEDDPDAAETLIRLLRGRASAYETLGNFNQALADLETALGYAGTTHSQEDDWQIALDLGRLWASRDYQRAGKFYERSLEIARALGDPALLAPSLNRVGNWYANLERPGEGIVFHKEALDLLETAGDEQGLAETLDLLGMASHLAGNLEAGNRYYNRAIELFERRGDRFGLISALTTLAFRGPNTRTVFLETPLGEALRSGERALQLSREIGWRAGEAYACFSLASLLVSMGEFTRAIELGKLSLAIAEEIQHRQWMAGAQASLGVIFVDLLEWDRAVEHLAEGARLGKEVGSRNWQVATTSWLAYCRLQTGEFDRAMVLLDELAPLKPSTQSLSSRIYWWASAEAANRTGNPEATLEICERLTVPPAIPDGAVVPQIWKVRANAHALLGDFPRAIALCEAALARCDETGDRSQAWSFAAQLGRLALKSGRQADAAAFFQDALERIETVSLTLDDPAQQALFRQRAAASLENDA
ncbi:MAG TPA: adenylate/guanylate cyclase domain-containing protein [Anaerolineales bacterium]|nr:adenylate/guanylate cyclase domain-containing protein [Anaerolineales bacterium]